jgi:3alpha(or 20beta)-hydroxysteroid dehydrogenase
MTSSPAPLVRLDDKVVLITGAARGQGAAEAELVLRLGGRVVLTDVLLEQGASRAAALGEHATFLPLDVADGGQWQAVVRETVALHGRIDVLVNNAGTYRKAAFGEWSDEDLLTVLAVNLVGPVLGMRAVAPVMPSGGSIVNVCSIAGMRGQPDALPYASSKWGLRGASRSAARDLGPRGIRVNAVFPGAVDTPMTAGVRSDLSALPLPRPGTVDEVAALVAFLASDVSSYCTGSEFVADGGALA